MRQRKKVLIVSQVIPQWYVCLLSNSFGKNVDIDIITGSNEIKDNVIQSPKYESSSIKKKFISWLKHYFFMKKWRRKNRHKKYDIVFATSNPPINPYICLKLKKAFNAKFIYMNWDLYPQIIKTSSRNLIIRFICKLWTRWNNRNFPKIDNVITVGKTMSESINADLKRRIPISIIPIGVDTTRLKPLLKNENLFCINNGISNRFIVLYSGKMGLGHNIEMILQASQKDVIAADILFVFIGFGPKYKVVESFIKNNNAKNIKLFPLQDEGMFAHSIACGDVGIVSQEASMAHLFMPSKVYSMMACGEAIIGIGSNNDDLYNLISEEKVGISVTDESPDTLAAVLMELYNNKTLLKTYKNNARKSSIDKFDLLKIQSEYETLFKRYI